MSRVNATLWLIAVTCLVSASAVLAQFSPSTYTPEVVDVGPNESCVKESGRLKCRWDGDCVKVGSQCFNCIGGYHYSKEMGTCWSCGQGTSLQNVNGSWVCK